jgi:hypothetical protein
MLRWRSYWNSGPARILRGVHLAPERVPVLCADPRCDIIAHRGGLRRLVKPARSPSKWLTTACAGCRSLSTTHRKSSTVTGSSGSGSCCGSHVLTLLLPDRCQVITLHHLSWSTPPQNRKCCDDADRLQLHPTYPLEPQSFQVRYTPCTVGSSSGRRDRPGGMYPLRVGVTMSITSSQPAGYDYLTRQVAALGCNRERTHRAGVLLHRTG